MSTKARPNRAQRWARRLTWATAAGLGLGAMGPFGSFFDGALAERLAYWTSMCWAGAIVLGLAVEQAAALAARWRLPLAFAAGVATLVACAPISWLSWIFGHALWPMALKGVTPLDWYGQALLIAAPLVAGALWLERRQTPPAVAQPAAEPAPAGAAAPPGLERLRDQVLCLQMEDHYVRAHLAQRSELVLATLDQAIGAMGLAEGAQVHRSWWVARAAVREAEQSGRNLTLVLTNGLRAPVARNRVAELRAKGWI